MARDLKDSIEQQTRQSRLAGLGELAGTVNHELRNPLTTISNSVEMLRHRLPDADAETGRLVDRIDRNVERCVDIVGDFLDFARPPVATRRPTAFDTWLDGVLDEHRAPDSVVVERALDAGATVALDGDRFARVVGNLLDNAAQAMTDESWRPAAGTLRRITVQTGVADGMLVLTVADTGPGITPENMVRLFEPLFTTKSFGVGLGLAAVRRIVTQHDGTIEVASTAGAGVRFTIQLPLAEPREHGAAA
jgi:signal transduction histidine kinase